MTTFKAYCRRNRRRDDAVGDICRDVLRDSHWPRQAPNPWNAHLTWVQYLRVKGATPAAETAFDAAWGEWKDLYLKELEARRREE